MTTRDRGLALLSTGIAACLTVLLATSCTSTEGSSPRRPPAERQATTSPSPTFVTFRWSRYPTCQEFATSFATQTYGTWYVDKGKDPTPSPEPLSAGEWDCLVRGRSKDGRAGG